MTGRHAHLLLIFLILLLMAVPVQADATGKQTGVEPSGPLILHHDRYIPNEVIVRFNPEVSQNENGLKAASADAHAQIGGRIRKDMGKEGLKGMHVVRLPPGINVSEAIRHYQKNPDVLYAEPNYILTRELFPDDPSFSQQWALHNTGQGGGTVDADIDAPEAWEITQGSRSIIIALIDSGIDYSHPDLSGNIWTNADEIDGNGIDDDHNGYIDDVHGWDFVNNDNDPYDDDGHGTHCAGIVGAAGNNSRGVAGINWEAAIMPLKILDENGDGTTDMAASAVLYAGNNGAVIASNSYGAETTYPPQSLKDAIDATGLVMVCAAGNKGKDIDQSPYYPASFSNPRIISVAASNNLDNLASFSNYGVVSVDVAAPGDSILNTYPGGQYALISGTSMAVPHVTGIAGLIASVRPDFSAVMIKDAILAGTDPASSLTGKVATGGRVNAASSLISIVSPGAEVVSDTIPGSMTPGESYDVAVTLRNSGSRPWSASFGDQLGGVGDWTGDAAKFGPLRIALPAGTTVAPGQTHTFTFTVTAPTATGTYQPAYQMVCPTQWFGQTLSKTITVGSAGQPDAEVVSDTIPVSMTPGQSYTVAVTLRNTGSSTWSTANGEQLGGVGDWTGDAAKFGPLRVALPDGTTVAPGQTHTFTFTLTAPTATGTYQPAYQMVCPTQWFGQTLSRTVTVSSGIPNAEVVSDTIPATMTPGQSYTVAVTLRNTGTSTWSAATGDQLGGVGDWTGDAAKFGSLRVALPDGTTVAPGQTHTFTFTLTAPTATGTYQPAYQMVCPTQWFGQTLSRTVTVSSGTLNAGVVASYIPATMIHGRSYSVYVTLKNTGTTTWTAADGICLGGVGDQAGDAAKFGPIRIPLPAGTTVAPGKSYRFLFTLTAPAATGTYNPQYRMVGNGDFWFGTTLSKTVTVK